MITCGAMDTWQRTSASVAASVESMSALWDLISIDATHNLNAPAVPAHSIFALPADE